MGLVAPRAGTQSEGMGELLASSAAPGGQAARGASVRSNLPIPFAQSAMEIPLKLQCKHVPE